MKILVNFVQRPEYLDFVIPELKSLFEMHNIKYEIDPEFLYNIKTNPVVYFNFEKNYSKEFQIISSRSVLTKNFVKVIN